MRQREEWGCVAFVMEQEGRYVFTRVTCQQAGVFPTLWFLSSELTLRDGQPPVTSECIQQVTHKGDTGASQGKLS